MGDNSPAMGCVTRKKMTKPTPAFFYMISEIDLNKLFAESMSFEI